MREHAQVNLLRQKFAQDNVALDRRGALWLEFELGRHLVVILLTGD